jgi:hypothetical protein
MFLGHIDESLACLLTLVRRRFVSNANIIIRLVLRITRMVNMCRLCIRALPRRLDVNSMLFWRSLPSQLVGSNTFQPVSCLQLMVSTGLDQKTGGGAEGDQQLRRNQNSSPRLTSSSNRLYQICSTNSLFTSTILKIAYFANALNLVLVQSSSYQPT